MKRLVLALAAILMVTVASDLAFAQRGGGGGGGSHGGGGGASGGGYHGGGHAGGGRGGGYGSGSHGGTWHGGGYGGGWHGSGWHGGGWHGGGWYGGGLGIYLGGPAYWGVWPYSYPYYGGYYPYYPYPIYGSEATTIYVEPPQQAPATPAYYWYYCKDPAGYYPYVQNCNNAWMTVVPQR